MYKFEKVEEKEIQTLTKYGKYSLITENILQAENNEWLKITGFENLKNLCLVINNLQSGRKSIVKTLKLKGIRLERITSKENLALYIRKILINKQ
jgi:hypothetical protein